MIARILLLPVALALLAEDLFRFLRADDSTVGRVLIGRSAPALTWRSVLKIYRAAAASFRGKK